MALTVVDNRDVKNEADATTGWTATDGPTLFTASPDPIEATGCLGFTASNAVEDAYVTITSDDFSGGGTLSIWIQDRAEFELTANVGIGMVIGDGTDRVAYAVGGSDGTAFRHDTGPVKWANFLLDPANLPADTVVLSGVLGNLTLTAITQVGIYVETLVKSVGGADNVFWDIIRWADPGVGIEVYGGTVGTPESLATLAALDRSTGTLQAYGIIRELSTGVYGVQGNINIGDTTTTNDTYLNIDTETISWEDRGLSTANYYRFIIAGNATGTTVVNILSSTLTVAGTASASFDTSDTNITFNATGTVFINFGNGIVTGGSAQDWTLTSFINCGQVVTNGADFTGASVSGYEGTAGTGALLYGIAVDPDGELDNCSFTKGTASTHAIEFDATNTPTTITLRNIDFSGYNAANGNNDSTLYFPSTSKSYTVNLVGCTGNISYRVGTGGSVTLVSDPVTLTFIIRDSFDNSLYQGARILAEVTSGINFPYQASISITGTGTTATVTHTAHGLVTGDYIIIRGASPDVYNGQYSITVTGVNTYTYTTNETIGTSPATGTITATFALISGLSDVNGEISDSWSISNDQPFKFRVAKATTAPFFVSATGTDTLESTADKEVSITLIRDGE